MVPRPVDGTAGGVEGAVDGAAEGGAEGAAVAVGPVRPGGTDGGGSIGRGCAIATSGAKASGAAASATKARRARRARRRRVSLAKGIDRQPKAIRDVK